MNALLQFHWQMLYGPHVLLVNGPKPTREHDVKGGEHPQDQYIHIVQEFRVLVLGFSTSAWSDGFGVALGWCLLGLGFFGIVCTVRNNMASLRGFA